MADCTIKGCNHSAGPYTVVLPIGRPLIVHQDERGRDSSPPRSFVRFRICELCHDRLLGAGPRKVLAALGFIGKDSRFNDEPSLPEVTLHMD